MGQSAPVLLTVLQLRKGDLTARIYNATEGEARFVREVNGSPSLILTALERARVLRLSCPGGCLRDRDGDVRFNRRD